MSKMTLRGKPEFGRVTVSMSGTELSEKVSGIWPQAHKGAHSDRFRGDAGKNIKRVGRDDIREVRDYSNAVPGIRSIVGRCVSRWSSMRKSRGRIRM